VEPEDTVVNRQPGAFRRPENPYDLKYLKIHNGSMVSERIFG
jgi:hypothetical protein